MIIYCQNCNTNGVGPINATDYLDYGILEIARPECPPCHEGRIQVWETFGENALECIDGSLEWKKELVWTDGENGQILTGSGKMIGTGPWLCMTRDGVLQGLVAGSVTRP